MRKFSSAAVIGVLVAMQGCTINLPTNLLDRLVVASTPGPKASGGEELPKTGGPEPMPSGPPIDVQPIRVAGFYGFESCEQALAKLDANGDGRLDGNEYAIWTFNQRGPAPCRTPMPPDDRERSVMTSPVRPTEPKVEPCDGGMAPMALPPFEHWDRNGDRFIDRAELCEETVPVMPPPFPPPMPCEDTFKRADRNGDGAVDLKEFSTADYAPPPMDGVARPAVMPSEDELIKRFKNLDVNGDGKLDPREFCRGGDKPQPPSPMPTAMPTDCYGTVKAYDRNQDGKVSWEEYFEGFLMPISARYDGQKDEVYALFKKLDLNGDGVLTPEEFCPPNTTPAPVRTKPPVTSEPTR